MGTHAGITQCKSASVPAVIADQLMLIRSRAADALAPADLEQLESFVARAARDHGSLARRSSSGARTDVQRTGTEWHFYRTGDHPFPASSAERERSERPCRGIGSGSGSGAATESVHEQSQSPAFTVPIDKECHLVYFPLSRTIIKTDFEGCRAFTSGAPNKGAQRSRLLPGRMRRGASASEKRADDAQDAATYLPTSVTLFPTLDCNLRCVYCYSSAGDNPHYMSVSLGKAAINQIVANALVLGAKEIWVIFHGGGEPTLNWSLLTSVTEYARRLAAASDMNVHITLGTNGCMPDYKRDWVVDNLDSLTLSLDGIAEVHNHQRPMRSGLGSFDQAFKTLRCCEEKQFPYGVRTTVAQESASHLVEFVELLAEQAPQAQGLQLEPICLTGRALATDQRPLHPEEFREAFLAAKQRGEKLGYRVTNSTCNISAIHDAYCGAYGRNFVVTPSGEVTTCYEVSDSGDPRWDTFHIGRYDPEARHWDFNATTILNLQSTRAMTLRSCQNCYARYHCAGGCPAKNRLALGSEGGDDRCDATRALICDALIDLARSASEQSWKTIEKRDLNLMKIQREETQMAKSDGTDEHPLDVTSRGAPPVLPCRENDEVPCWDCPYTCMPVVPNCPEKMFCMPLLFPVCLDLIICPNDGVICPPKGDKQPGSKG